MKTVYLLFCVLGTLLPYLFLLRFLREYGLDVPLMVEQLFANDISTFFAVDLIISSIVFWVFAWRESRAHQIRLWWVSIVANLVVGLSLALPLFLYLREIAREPEVTEIPHSSQG